MSLLEPEIVLFLNSDEKQGSLRLVFPGMIHDKKYGPSALVLNSDDHSITIRQAKHIAKTLNMRLVIKGFYRETTIIEKDKHD